jgi:NifU-like protein involved in Fe-S cluster formation
MLLELTGRCCLEGVRVLNLCGYVQVDDDGNIVDAKFKTFGCGSAIASSSVATEWVRGKTLDEALTIKNSDIAKHLSLPPVKLHCSMLAEDAIKAAVDDIRKRRKSVNVSGGAEYRGGDQPAAASTAP